MGFQRQRGAFFSRIVGASDPPWMQRQKDFSPPGGRFGPAPHSDGCFFSGMLPVPRSHHSPCCCPRCKATHPLHNEEEEEKWGDWGPLPAYLFPLDADLSPLAGCWTTPLNRSGFFLYLSPNCLTEVVQETEALMVIVEGKVIWVSWQQITSIVLYNFSRIIRPSWRFSCHRDTVELSWWINHDEVTDYHLVTLSLW